MNLHKEAAFGAAARALMENEVYKSAVMEVRGAILKAWESAPMRDRDGQHELKLMLKLLNDLEANIKQAADTGKLAEIQIAREKEKESAMKRILRFGR